MNNINERIEKFVELAQKLQEEPGHVNYALITVKYGKKYAKVICDTSAWAFIDLSNGDVLKPASWAKPALKARANIFSEDYGMSGVTKYGPNYLR